MRFAMGLICLGLTACAADPARLAAQKAAQDSADDAQCRQYGAAPGTPAYIDCRQRSADRRSTENIARADRNAYGGNGGLIGLIGQATAN